MPTTEQLDPESVSTGDTLTDFRGNEWTFVEWEGHKVVVVPRGSSVTDWKIRRTFFAGVVGIRDPRLDPPEAA